MIMSYISDADPCCGHSQSLAPSGASYCCTIEKCMHAYSIWKKDRCMSYMCHYDHITWCDSLIPLQCFQLFGKREMQVLISGAEVSINACGGPSGKHTLLRYIHMWVCGNHCTVLLSMQAENGVKRVSTI